MSSATEASRPACTRRSFLRAAAGAVPGLALAGAAAAAPAPLKAAKPRGFLVLDDCDPTLRGLARADDNLSFYDPAGKLVARVGGLNNCDEIGSPHRIAVDLKRECVWVAENLHRRLLQLDLKGRELRALRGVRACAVAVDPATGNVWVPRDTGTIGGEGHTDVYSPAGKRLASHDFHGQDIAYDPKGKAFWLAEGELLKVSPAGRVLARQPLTVWAPESVAVNPKTGAVWVVTGRYDEQRFSGGRNELLGFDNAGRRLHTVALGDHFPTRVAVDADTGAVWVTAQRRKVLGFAVARKPDKVLKFTAAGKPDGELKVAALAADVEVGTGNVWAVTDEEVLKLDKKGKVLARAKHKGRTDTAWALSY